MKADQARSVVDEIFSLYDQYGAADYIGEPVSQIEHMCQAAQLAEAEDYDEEVILAAFFHDIGHLCEHIFSVQSMDGYGTVDHESLGGQYLRDKGFSEKIARLVESHVEAKRYLTFKYPDYYNKLSEASKITLDKQGGIMDEIEAQQFERDHLQPLFIKIREWDDKAKIEQIPLPSLDIYKQMALHHLMRQN
ncbi:MAG TPA: HD domain-containing protein [Chitinophagaceae bacterium]|jgi:phosphonate degradation associated HDIG domain protein|nr:HD domain-containing protein [Chitinophagaceae bacterium]